MFIRILKKLQQQVMWVLVVALVLLAAYVSIGREFMPVVSRYADFFEEQIATITGLSVNVDSLTGSFQGFNPSIRINGLRLLVDERPDSVSVRASSALQFEQATLAIDVMRSIWQRRWVFEQFLVEGLAIEAEQTESGLWQLHDINVSGASNVDPAALYQALLQVARLDLRDVQVVLTTRNQNTIQIANGSAVIQNRNGNHFLHVNAGLENSSEQLALSVEVRGDSLEAISGRVHMSIPNADYSSLFIGERIGESTIEKLTGGGEFWMRFTNGRLREVTASIALDLFDLRNGSGNILGLHDVSGDVQLLQGEDDGNLELIVTDMRVGAGDLLWAPFNAHLSIVAEQSLALKADLIDLSLLNQVALSSGFLSEAAAAQLSGYNPQGELANLDVYWPLAGDSERTASVRSNLQQVAIGSVNGSPSLWGLDGYLEVLYDGDARVARGFGEIESERFRINIPSVFVDTWDYNYVNGRLDFRVDLNDGQHIAMVSTPVVARSDIVDGRVQFASRIERYADGRREANLDLLVGVLAVDAEKKAPYLPSAPNIDPGLKQTMQWLNDAVLDGTLQNSGVIFRGSTIPGSPALTKTFQSYYALEDGVLAFSADWPQLTGISGLVRTNDEKIDINVGSASSMGIAATEVSALVRRNENAENWLEIVGAAAAPITFGFAYLQSAPVGEGLQNAMRNWEAEGDFAADIEVRVPLNNPEANTDVRLEIALEENSLTLPDYALNITDLTGPVVFDTRTGLEPRTLSGKIFDNTAEFNLSSVQDDRQLQNIVVSASGETTPQELIEWPMQSSFVRQLLADMHGQFRYVATVTVPQAGNRGTSLVIDSSLEGAELTLPAPFSKTAESRLPLHLDILFDGDAQRISGTLGANIALALRLDQGALQGGLLALGENYTNVDAQIDTESSGLAVLGEVEHLQVESWVNYLRSSNGSGGSSNALGESLAFIDINVNSLEVYEILLPDVGVRIESNAATGYWDIDLSGDAVSGTVNVPEQSDEYLKLDLAYLHIPGAESEAEAEKPADATTVAEIPDPAMPTEPVERIDVLAEIDPRALPKMQFATEAFTIGERPFGAWRFTLDPVASGAEFSNLAFDFRGLRLGDFTAVDAEAGAEAPHFSWHYDGVQHTSALNGQILASNLADVLTANGIAPSLESASARFETDISWPGSPAFFAGAHLSGDILLDIDEGRFQQVAGSSGALKLISIINFDAIMRRLRFSDDLLRRGLAYDSIDGNLSMVDGQVTIVDRLVISGPSSLYQITGELNLTDQTINSEMFLTLPVSANIPWLGLLTANIPLAVGAYLFDRIFGDQVNNLTSAVYTLQGPWEGLQPVFKQAFGSPGSTQQSAPAVPAQ